MDLIGLEKRIESSIRKQGISFTEEGYPLFPEDILLREGPGDIIPYRQKYAAGNKKKNYGALDHKYADILEETGTPYKVFVDFKSRCFDKGAHKCQM